MVEKKFVEEIIFTVYCVNGEKLVHRYKLPPTHKEIEKLIKDTIHMINDAFTGKLKILFFTNPIIHYNPKNVVGVEVSSITTEEIETLIKEAQKSIGFKKSWFLNLTPFIPLSKQSIRESL